MISFFRIVALFTSRLPADEMLAHVNKCIALITADTNNALTKSKILVTVYNMFDPARGDARFALFLALTDLCVRAKLASQIVARLASLDALVAAWKVSPVTSRPLYYAAHRALSQCGNGAAALAMLVRYLQTFGAADTDAQGEAAKVAQEAAVQAVGLSGVFVASDVLALSAVQRMRTDTDASRRAIFDLLACLVGGSMDEFERLVVERDAPLRQLGINIDAARHKMRLLTVAAACSDACTAALAAWSTASTTAANAAVVATSDTDADVDNGIVRPATVSLSAVATALAVADAAAAEQWLVRAACEGLVRVKVDQLEQRAVVSYALRRQVTRADWKVLSGTLDAWAGNIDRLLATQMQAAKANDAVNATATGVPSAAT